MLILAALAGRLADAGLLLILIISHECAHLAVAKGLGYEIAGIDLMICGGIARLGPETAVVPGAEMAIAAAGPLHHVVLLLLTSISAPFRSALGEHWGFFFRANQALALFNLLPIYPLDGGRILRAGLIRANGVAAANRLAGSIGRAMAVGLVIGGAIALLRGKGPLLAGSGLYLLLATPRHPDYILHGYLRLQAQKLRRLRKHGAIGLRWAAVSPDASVWNTLSILASRDYLVYLVVDAGGHILALISEEEAAAHLMRTGLGASFATIISAKNAAGVPPAAVEGMTVECRQRRLWPR